MARCLYLLGAGREKRIHCIPPFTPVRPLEFEDIRFKVEEFMDVTCSVTARARRSWISSTRKTSRAPGSSMTAISWTSCVPGSVPHKNYLRTPNRNDPMESNWLLRVRNLTKVYGEASPEALVRTGPKFTSNFCPKTGAVVACGGVKFPL